MLAGIIYALAGLRGVLRITHATPTSYTRIDYVDAGTVQAIVTPRRSSPSPAIWGGESPTRKYMLISTPEQKAEGYRKIMSEAEADNKRIREYGCSWAGN